MNFSFNIRSSQYKYVLLAAIKMGKWPKVLNTPLFLSNFCFYEYLFHKICDGIANN